MKINALYANGMKEHSTKLLHSYFLTIPTSLCERQCFITSIFMKAQLGQRSFNLVVGGCQRHSSGRGFDPRLGVKKIPLTNSTQSTWSRPGQSSWATGPCVRVGKAHVPKHKLRTDPWIVLTGDGPLCMGGCGVRGVFSACVRRLLNIKPWGRSFPYMSSFFLKLNKWYYS
jgi:hypothetical protein